MLLFKTGFGYISTPVTLGSDETSKAAGRVEEERVRQLPSFAIHGTVTLQG